MDGIIGNKYYAKHYYSGKSSDCLAIYNWDCEEIFNIIYRSDRLSAFDRHICNVPGKGYILSKQNEWWMQKLDDVADLHFIHNIGNASIVKKCIPIKLEFIVRGYLTGSLWNEYKKGVRIVNGYTLPDNMIQNQKLDELIVTPTTKGSVDTPITYEEIISRNILEIDELEKITKSAINLFKKGSEIAEGRGIILADTKYEFGYDYNGKIMLIDELHTSDNSRFWLRDTYEKNIANPDSYDKDVIRQIIFDCHDKNISLDFDEISDILIKKYKELYKIFTNIDLEHRECYKPPIDDSKLENGEPLKKYYGSSDISNCVVYIEMLQILSSQFDDSLNTLI